MKEKLVQCRSHFPKCYQEMDPGLTGVESHSIKQMMMMKMSLMMITSKMRCDDVFWINSNIKSIKLMKGGWDTLRAISGLAEPASDYINDQRADFEKEKPISGFFHLSSLVPG